MTAAAHTLTIVQAACSADPGVAKPILDRVIGILRSGCDAPGAAATLSEREAGAVLGLSRTTICRWQAGKLPHLGPFPFAVAVDIKGHRRYDRREVVDYATRRFSFSPHGA